MFLEGKRILVTGVLTERSIAFAVAREAQIAGAEVLLTTYGRTRRLTTAAAQSLPRPASILELDATVDADFESLTDVLLEARLPLHAALHAIAWAPPALVHDGLLSGARADVNRSFEASVYSYQQLAKALAPAMRDGGSLVGLTFSPAVAWPGYDWLGVFKAALEGVNRYLAYHLGPLGIRTNLLAAGPIRSVASEVFANFDVLCDAWEDQAPLGWDAEDSTSIARAACLLMSDWAAALTGGIVHADGGYHAVARPARFNFAAQPEEEENVPVLRSEPEPARRQ
jgi:enoyl-[acyl-carrier protein] reductase I